MSKDEGLLYDEDPQALKDPGENKIQEEHMDQHIKRINRELKFKGKIIDFYQDTMEITGEDGTTRRSGILSGIRGLRQSFRLRMTAGS